MAGDEYAEAPEDVLRELEPSVALPLASARAMLESLSQVDEFLRCFAGPVVRAELRAFGVVQGWDPVCGSNAFLDRVSFQVPMLRRAIEVATAQDVVTDRAVRGVIGA